VEKIEAKTGETIRHLKKKLNSSTKQQLKNGKQIKNAKKKLWKK
jgi:hypothetical protein